MTLFRLLRVWIASLGFFALAGCAPKDEISVYEVDSEAPNNAIRKPVILIAAIVPQSDRIHWIFKVAGSEEAMAAARESILEFFKTIEFPKGNPKKGDAKDDDEIRWKLPPTWTDLKDDREFRYTSISIPSKGETLDLSVSFLDKRGAKILPNVNRWREQVYRNPITEKELPLITKKFATAGVEATLVEIKGFKLSLPEEREPFQYFLPPGWQKGQKTPISLLSFRVGQGLKQASISVSPAGGSLDMNLNRWREQVLLPTLEKDALLKETKSLKVAGQEAVYVDYATPAGKELERESRRILGAVLQLDGNQLFIKMTGPPDLVEQQKANFERFATSLTPTKDE